MPRHNRFAWSNQTQEEQIEMAHRASRDDLRLMARAYDWSNDPERVLGWIMSKKSIDLGSALTVFFNGDPARFNYLPKRDIPEEYNSITTLLDNICLRVNSGFYRISPSLRVDGRKRMEVWLLFQAEDRMDGLQGRWILDEGIVRPALDPLPRTQELPDMSGIKPQEPSASGAGPVATALSKRVVELFSEIMPSKRAG